MKLLPSVELRKLLQGDTLMKVFISWSGERSHRVASLLYDWIRCVLQATQPWMSSRDIDRGAIWFNEIGNELAGTTNGIICLTKENLNKPWILFEAGALAKGLTSSRVYTFLIDLKHSDISDPLAQINHTLPTKDSLRGLVATLNRSLGTAALASEVLERVFETYWHQFEEGFKISLEQTPAGPEIAPMTDNQLLREVLETTRGVRDRVGRLEAAAIQTRFDANSPLPLSGIAPSVKGPTGPIGPSGPFTNVDPYLQGMLEAEKQKRTLFDESFMSLIKNPPPGPNGPSGE